MHLAEQEAAVSGAWFSLEKRPSFAGPNFSQFPNDTPITVRPQFADVTGPLWTATDLHQRLLPTRSAISVLGNSCSSCIAQFMDEIPPAPIRRRGLLRVAQGIALHANSVTASAIQAGFGGSALRSPRDLSFSRVTPVRLRTQR
jgi:hypothetical protein